MGSGEEICDDPTMEIKVRCHPANRDEQVGPRISVHVGWYRYLIDMWGRCYWTPADELAHNQGDPAPDPEWAE